MRKTFYLIMMSCLLTAGQALADGSVSLPTVVIRESADGSKTKIEYAYDPFGHIVSEKWSIEQNGTYVPEREITREFHRLPNGEFALTKEEGQPFSGSEKVRHSIAYDDKGMELWNRYVYESGESGEVYMLREAVVDENGIRTAVRTFNAETGKMEIDPNYTFDNRGRTTQAIDYGNTYTFTWNDADRITGFSGTVEGTFHNMVLVTNDEYFNPYALNPLLERSKSVEDDYVWNDYTLHEWLFSADGDRMTVRATVDQARGEATQIVHVGDVEQMKIVYKKGANGSYSITQTWPSDGGTYTDERGREYNEYGAVIRDYSVEDDTGDGYYWEQESVYEREYDAEGRPVQTICVHNGETLYTETYSAWTGVTPVGNETTPALPDIRVYPNPAVDVIVIDGVPDGSTLVAYDLSGRVVYRQANIGGRETVSVSSWPKGLYFMTIQTQAGIVTHKTVKK